MEKGLQFRPLHLVERLAGELGEGITYVYDDLVFIGNSEVLLQFDDGDMEAVILHVNSDVHPDDLQKITGKWSQVALVHGIRLTCGEAFTVEQSPGT